ncbi:hypothetical protein ACWFPY_20300 [Nocardia fluminea]
MADDEDIYDEEIQHLLDSQIGLHDADLRMDGDRALYKGKPFTGDIVDDISGVIVESYEYVDGIRAGYAYGRYPDGSPRFFGEYRRGLPGGHWTVRNAAGGLIEEYEFDPSGCLRYRKKWNDNGVLIEDFDATAIAKPTIPGVRDREDPDIHYDSATDTRYDRSELFTGQLAEYTWVTRDIVELSWYARGHWDGPQLAWYPLGSRKYAGTSTHGQHFGLWLAWHEDGTLSRRSLLGLNGTTLLLEEWDESGQRTDHTTDPDVRVEELLHTDYEDGKLIRAGMLTPTGPVGYWCTWDSTGRIRREDHYSPEHQLLLRRDWDGEGALDRPVEGSALQPDRTQQ